MASWLIAWVMADMTADSAARLDVTDPDEGEDGDPPHPAARLRLTRMANRFREPMGDS